MGDPSRGTSSRRISHGTHIAIGAIAVFALLLFFVLFYHGDRPRDAPLPLNAEEQAALEPPQAAALPEAPPLAEPAESAESAEQDNNEASNALPSAQHIPKKKLRTKSGRSALELGAKPPEAPISVPLARATPDLKDTGRPIGAEEIRRVVGENERDVKSCYRDKPVPARVATKSKKIEVWLKVDPSGEVAAASVRNALPSDESACIETKAKSWRFKAPGGEAPQEVTVPFVVVSGTG